MEQLDDLQTMSAVASEHGRILAFRACEESEEFEPVFMRVEGGDGGEGNETAMIAITDANGMSLGSYVISRRQLDAALAEPGDASASASAADRSPADRLV